MTAQHPAAPETERLHVLIDNGEDALQTCTGCDWESWDAAPSFADHIPAAPETDPDANGLRELLAAATPGPWQHFGDHLVWPSERGPAANDPIAEVSEEHQECAALIVAAVNALPALLADLDAARERVRVVEGERDAAPTGAAAIGRVLDLEGQVDLARARAESAEAAHERLRAGIWALGESIHGDEGVDHVEGCEGEPTCFACILDTLRALLAGGGAR